MDVLPFLTRELSLGRYLSENGSYVPLEKHGMSWFNHVADAVIMTDFTSLLSSNFPQVKNLSQRTLQVGPR